MFSDAHWSGRQSARWRTSAIVEACQVRARGRACLLESDLLAHLIHLLYDHPDSILRGTDRWCWLPVGTSNLM
jgi:hypothetical protein